MAMEIEDILREHAKRLQAIDPMLPGEPPTRVPSDATTLTTPNGVGYAMSTRVEASSGFALWRPLSEYRFDVRLAGDDPSAELDALLDRWDALLADEPADDWESAAVVPRASRDTAGSDALLRHGFAASRVLAVRPADRLGSGPAAVPGVIVREAEPRDRDTIVGLHFQLRRFDAQFGVVSQRAHEQTLLGRQVDELLDTDAQSLWIAELYGKPLGFVHAELMPASSWIARFAAAEQVGYLASLHVDEEARGSGVGTALAAHAHQVFDQAGAEAVLLHHAVANPRSGPFWYAQGYRPLWTEWYRRPARR